MAGLRAALTEPVPDRCRLTVRVVTLRGGPRPRRARVTPSAVRTQQRAVVGDARADALAAVPADRAPEQRVALAQRGERRPGRLGQPPLQRREQLRERRLQLGRRPAERRGAVAHARPAARSRSTATLRPMPSTAQPSCGPRLDEDPRRACGRRASTSLGHFTRAAPPGEVGDREARAQRQQRVGGRAGRASSSSAWPGRRGPGPALAAAARGLLAGGHERAVRRARRGELPRAVVGRAVVRRCSRGRPSAFTPARAPPGRRAPTQSAAAASPALSATATSPAASS